MRYSRRSIVSVGSTWALLSARVSGAIARSEFDDAAQILSNAVASRQVRAASLYVQRGSSIQQGQFGEARSPKAAFLLGSISKPIAVSALLRLLDEKKLVLDVPAHRYLPELKEQQRERITVRQLLTHTSGLVDQLPNNAELRAKHAPLADFVTGALQLIPKFEPGSQFRYSSMAILLACEIAQRLAGVEIKRLVQETVLDPINMRNSALGMGQLEPSQVMQNQTEFGAPESGAGDPAARAWDWNSNYWRNLGAPWGGMHASAEDVAQFLTEFQHPSGRLLQQETAAMAILNQNATGITPRGLGFDVGLSPHWPGCSNKTFGHTGSTGTIAWCDPLRDLTCVVLTTLPGNALPHEQHPRHQASDAISNSNLDSAAREDDSQD